MRIAAPVCCTQQPSKFDADSNKCIHALHNLLCAIIDVCLLCLSLLSQHTLSSKLSLFSWKRFDSFYLRMGDVIDMQVSAYKAAVRGSMHSFHYLPKGSIQVAKFL